MKKYFLAGLAILAAVSAVSSAAAQCPPATGGDPDGDYIIAGTRAGVPYANGLTMDVYTPAGPPRPAALVIRGRQGDHYDFITKVYEALTRSGYAWFVPDYRSEEDVAAAIQFVECKGRFPISGGLVLVGEDNGAAIALKLGGPGGVVTIAANMHAVGETRPAAGTRLLMLQGDQDKENLPQAEALCKTLKNCTLYVQTPGAHSFTGWHPQSEDYREELDAWLRKDQRGLWKDISYARPGGRDLGMDAFIPRGTGPFPAVIVVHGGGMARDKVTYIAPIFEPLAKANIAWFSIDYPSLQFYHRPDQLDRLRDAIRHVKKHAARYHVDPNRLALMGESYSAPMVTIVASKPCPGCEVQAVLSFYGSYKAMMPTNETARARMDALYGAGAWTEQTVHEYAPYELAHKGMPPVLVVQGTGENGGAERSTEYSEHLKELGVPSELLLVEGAPHGIENWEEHPEWSFYKQKVVEWLKLTWK